MKRACSEGEWRLWARSMDTSDERGRPSSISGIVGIVGEGRQRKSLFEFEPESGRFTSFWTDSRQTRMSVRQSQDPFDGQQVILYSRPLESDGPEARRSKTVSRLEDGGLKLIDRQYAL